jgi:glycosyltransferase involved in cell wall biosynthesis
MLCHNRLDLSKKCLESYLNTISVPYELVIVDNASTDATGEWLAGVREDPRIKTIIHREKNDPASALNTGLMMCSGRYLHVMENDYIYRNGWDTYVLNCFDKVPDLGQLCVCYGVPDLIGQHYENLIYLSLENVVSSSVFPRKIYFDHHLRWQNIHSGSMPDDEKFSHEVKKRGFLVAWPDRPITEAAGFSTEEFKRDPDYYINNYKQKLRHYLTVRSFFKNILHSGIDWRIKESMKRLFILYWFKVKDHFTA